jgi:hypothetical protein
VHLIYLVPPVAGIALAAAIGWLIERENVPRKEVPHRPDEKVGDRPPDGIRDATGSPAVRPGEGDGATAGPVPERV